LPPETPQPPPSQIMMQMITGKWVSQCLTVVANLGVADLMKEGPVGVKKLAKQTGADADALNRVLRMLAAIGVFSEPKPETFGLTPVSELLRADVPNSMRDFARWIGEDSAWRAWGHADHTVRTGRPAFNKVLGSPVYKYLARNREAGAIFNGALSNLTHQCAQAIVEGYDFSGIRQLVDIGGGHGALLSAIVTRYPSIQGTLFDMPEVIATAGKALKARGSTAPIAFEKGDFLKKVPAGADAYIMKHIVQNFDDETSVKLLTHCRKALARGGKVLVVEQLITNGPESIGSKLLDLELMVMTERGRERTEDEYAALFRKAGLKLSRVVPTQSSMFVLEAKRS
jgi:hypothetical protein